jgi:sugar lactone lactonase YvrE
MLCAGCGGAGGGGSAGAANPGTVISGGSSGSGTPAVAAPAITTQPAAQSVDAGASVSLSVAASGAGIAYQWQRNGVAIVGATGAAYSFPASLDDNGSSFTVTVSNAGGSVTSSPAAVHVAGIDLVAGSATEWGSTDGAGAQARFHGPAGVALDASGNLFVADTFNHTIRKITPQHVVTTFAGSTGREGKLDGNGAAARLAYPAGLAVDAQGNLYVADTGYLLVRKITPAADVTTFYKMPLGANVDSRSYGMFEPGGVAADAAGHVIVTNDIGTRRIAPDGSYSMLEGDDTRDNVSGSFFGNLRGVALTGEGELYVDSLANMIARLDAGGTAVVPGTAGYRGYLAADKAGNVYVADYDHFLIRKITPAGTVSTVAGDGTAGGALGATLDAPLPAPRGIAVDGNGVLYVAAGQAIVRIVPR